ncbi:MAG: hypothetical protein KDF59_10415 [Nitrosomonas sp.]|nr:hypothetical protein [Nitrosomonas sp.]
MKRFVVFIALTLIGFNAEAKITDHNKLLSAQLLEFQQAMEETFALRQAAVSFFEKIQYTPVLSGDNMVILGQGMDDNLRLQHALMIYQQSYQAWVRNTQNVKQLERLTRIKGVLIALNASLALYDNYALAVYLYEKNPRLNAILNTGDQSFDRKRSELFKSGVGFHSSVNRQKIRQAITFIDANETFIREMADDDELAYLYTLMQMSPSLYVLKDRANFLKNLHSDFTFYLRQIVNYSTLGGKDTVNFISMVFGNTVGIVQTRKGKLYNQPEIEAYLKTHLKPLDILLEKTPFRLTDKLIPGHFGHAAIWLGTKTELIELGIWDHPDIRPYHPQIEDGRMIVEALRSGVKINSLADFMNIDDLAVIRHNHLSATMTREYILRTARQIGKSYDFNFDVEEQERIVCSEIAYVVFTDLNWPTQKTLGRHTISPDNIVQKVFMDNPKLSLTAFFHDGEIVDIEPKQRLADLTGL